MARGLNAILPWHPLSVLCPTVAVALAALLAAGCPARTPGPPGDATPPPAAPERCRPRRRAAPAPTAPARSRFRYRRQRDRVELRGDFAADGWTGVPAHADASGDSATPRRTPAGRRQYKFVVDGNWIADPATPTRSPDGFGGQNSVREPTHCDQCAPRPDFDWRDAVIYFVFVDRFFDGDPANDVPSAASRARAGRLPGRRLGRRHAEDRRRLLQRPRRQHALDHRAVRQPDVAGSASAATATTTAAYHGYWPKLDLDQPLEARFGTLAELKALVDARAREGHQGALRLRDEPRAQRRRPIYQPHHTTGSGRYSKNGRATASAAAPLRLGRRTAERCWFTRLPARLELHERRRARDYSVDNAVEWIKRRDRASTASALDAIKHVDISWLTDLRARLNERDRRPDAAQRFYMVGETFDRRTATSSSSTSIPQTKLDGQFDFPLRAKLVSAASSRRRAMSDLAAFMDSNDYYYGASAVMSTFIGNHDLPRIIHLAADTPLWGDDWADGKDRAWGNQPRPAVGELGRSSASRRPSPCSSRTAACRSSTTATRSACPARGDPDNRRFMQWSGLTANQTWLRSASPACSTSAPRTRRSAAASARTLSAAGDMYVYEMLGQGEEVYVALNRGDQGASAGGLPAGTYARSPVRRDGDCFRRSRRADGPALGPHPGPPVALRVGSPGDQAGPPAPQRRQPSPVASTVADPAELVGRGRGGGRRSFRRGRGGRSRRAARFLPCCSSRPCCSCCFWPCCSCCSSRPCCSCCSFPAVLIALPWSPLCERRRRR